MTDTYDVLSENAGSFQFYVDDSVNPGNSILIATLLFCILLLAILPCMVCIGKRFQKHESDFIESSRGQENASETINGASPSEIAARMERHNRHLNDDKPTTDDGKNQGTKQHQPDKSQNSDDDDSNSSSSSDDDTDHSVKTGGLSVASAILNAILDSSPHGGVIKRRHQRHTAMREDHLSMSADGNIDHDSFHDNRSNANQSVMGSISHDEVSIHDAIDAATLVRKDDDPLNDQDSMNIFCPAICGSWFTQLLLIADYDYETKRLMKLGLPFVIQAIMVGVMRTARVALVGKFIGTPSLSAFIIVELAVGTTDVFLLGLIEACASMCSHAVGVGNKKLAGQYIQIATILFTLCYIPIFVFWMFMIGPLFTWLGFDGKDDGITREIGEQFTLLYLFASFIKGVNTSSHALLDVIGKENYSATFVICEEVAATLATLAAALQPGASDLNLVGLLLIAVQGAALIINSLIIAYNGWFDKFLDGLVGSFALKNVKATKLLLTTAAALSFGSLLAYGAWEILTIFASFLGPAEVAAWGLLGTLWDSLEIVTEAVADAGEVRTALLLGAGKPAQAKLSSYKILYLGTFASIFITACMFIAGESVPTWLTNDPTLQRMTAELLPLFGIGNIALSIGTLSWTLVGAQGRFRLSTAVGLSGGWFVALPMAAIFTIVYNIDLQGQTAAIVVGYMVSGTINSYILLQSDWPKLSRRVISQNDGLSVGSDDSSDSSSSSEPSASDSVSNSRK